LLQAFTPKTNTAVIPPFFSIQELLLLTRLRRPNPPYFFPAPFIGAGWKKRGERGAKGGGFTRGRLF
jgi:hypothetical protein